MFPSSSVISAPSLIAVFIAAAISAAIPFTSSIEEASFILSPPFSFIFSFNTFFASSEPFPYLASIAASKFS